jgi:hypothetical protein
MSNQKSKFIKTKIQEFITENKTYDDLVSLKDWYSEENQKLNKIKDYKTWKLKSRLLQKQYYDKRMEIIKKENPFGLEGNMNANYIYHYTNGDSLGDIIRNNILIGGNSGISFTSHPNLYKRGFVFWYPNEYGEGRHHGNIGIKMKFDFNKMKEDGLKFIKGSEDLGTHLGEDELRLKQDELKNPIKYIKEIIIFEDKEKKYLELSNLLTSHNILHKIL